MRTLPTANTSLANLPGDMETDPRVQRAMRKLAIDGDFKGIVPAKNYDAIGGRRARIAQVAAAAADTRERRAASTPAARGASSSAAHQENAKRGRKRPAAQSPTPRYKYATDNVLLPRNMQNNDERKKMKLAVSSLFIDMELKHVLTESADGTRLRGRSTAREDKKEIEQKKEIGKPVEQDIKKEKKAEKEEVATVAWLPICDRSAARKWDKQEASLNELRREVAEEGSYFGDYYEMYRAEAEELLRKEEAAGGLPFDPATAKKRFYGYEIEIKNRSDSSHASKGCAKFGMRSGPISKTVEHVKSILRFIAIGALCERCVNPFDLSAESLNAAAPHCTCPVPAEPVFRVVPRSPENIPEGRTKEEILAEDWDAMCKREEKKARRGIKKRLIDEMGEEAFKQHYPLYKKSLESRTDEFGRAVYRKQQDLHALRRAHNQPPTFILAWTSKTTGSAYLPQEWMLDGQTELSNGAEKKLKSKKGLDQLKCKCADNCASGRCCSGKIRVDWHINKNGILQQKNGLGPCGTEVDSICQPHETHCVQAAVCGPECGCDISCPSRFAERGSQKMKILFMTHTVGWSLRTVEAIVRGEYILSFSGVVSTQKEMAKNGENMEMILDLSKKGTKLQDVLTLTTDARSNEFRCINHSCAPNTLMVAAYGKKWGDHVYGGALFSRRPLRPFEEMTWDYYGNGERNFRFDCRCGTYACRGIKVASVEE